MGKHGDPLRAQARISGVKKSHRTHKDSRTLPSWYYRVLNISKKENRDVMGYDFDEDLSEIEDGKGRRSDDADQSKNEGCMCGGSEDSERDCYIEDVDMDEDDESERSYDGFDADFYYEMKNERKERKREKQQERKEKEQQREFEREMEEEVHATERTLYQARKKRNSISIESLAGQSFHLFCSAHVDHFYTQDFYANKTVDFYYPYDEDDYSLDKPKLDEESGLLYGYVYLDPSAGCEFGPFRPPKYASRKATKVKSLDGKYDLSFKFVGNGHLKLRVSKDMVFMDEYNASPRAPPPAAPKVFEFFGISSDREKEEVERQERIAKIHSSPSPGENWFEINHTMGW